MSASLVIDALAQSVSTAIGWATGISIFLAAAFMAVSVLAWLVHRS